MVVPAYPPGFVYGFHPYSVDSPARSGYSGFCYSCFDPEPLACHVPLSDPYRLFKLRKPRPYSRPWPFRNCSGYKTHVRLRVRPPPRRSRYRVTTINFQRAIKLSNIACQFPWPFRRSPSATGPSGFQTPAPGSAKVGASAGGWVGSFDGLIISIP